jgi:hypothetical protein
VDAVECLINPRQFDPAGLTVFRSLYPKGSDYVLGPAIKTPCGRRYCKLTIHCISVGSLPWAAEER